MLASMIISTKGHHTYFGFYCATIPTVWAVIRCWWRRSGQ